MASLRAELQKITHDGNLENHARRIAELRAQVPHSIEILTKPGDNLRYNCIMHALGVPENTELIGLVMRCPRSIHPNTRFLKFLKDRGILSPIAQLAAGQVVTYSNGRGIRHAGRTISELVVESKWGIGHLYRHALMEVPSSYGNKLSYFAPPDAQAVVGEFIEFARSQGARV